MFEKTEKSNKRKKLTLDALKIKSFVTISSREQEALRGGSTGGCFPTYGASAGNRCTTC